MNNTVEDFLNMEERLRNRTIAKRFRTWLFSNKGALHLKKIEMALSRPNTQSQASGLLKKAEAAYKADDAFKRQDKKRQKSLKQFHEAFEKWLGEKNGKPYKAEIDRVLKQSYPNLDDRQAEIERASQDAEKAFARENPHMMPDDYKDLSKTRVRPVRYGFTEEVEDVIFNVIEPGLKQFGFAGQIIIRNWVEIVGPALAENTRVEKVLFPPKSRTHGTLIVKARPGHNTIIQHQMPQYIFKINSYFGFAAIADIHISKIPFVDIETPGAKSSRRIISSRITPAEAPSPRVQELIKHIDDPDFKALFEDMGKIMKARNG